MTEYEIESAARHAYCRGFASESMFHTMWNLQPSVSIGWSRDELIAFALTIEAKIKRQA